MSRDNFLSSFLKICKVFGNKSALIYQQSGTCVNFSDINNLTDLLKTHFESLFTTSNVYIGVSVGKTWLLAILLALWKANLSVYAINPQLTIDIVTNVVNGFITVRYILSDTRPPEPYKPISCFSINNSTFFVWRANDKIENVNKIDMCYALTTSGSTGCPKSVQVPWSCIIPNAEELTKIFSISFNDVISCTAPYTFDPFFVQLFMALMTGAELMMDFTDRRSDQFDSTAVRFSCIISDLKRSSEDVTVLQTTPSLYHLTGSAATYPKLRTLILGGEPFSMIYEPARENLSVYNIYGITEISCWSFLHLLQKPNTRVPIGKPLKDIVYRLKEDGELLIGSSKRKCIVNEENFLENQNDFVFRSTGDLVEVDPDTGDIFFLCRKEYSVKKMGAQVFLGKIEKMFEAVNRGIKLVIAFDESTQAMGLFIVDKALKEEFIVVKDQSSINFPKGLTDIEKPDLVISISKLPLTQHGKINLNNLKSVLSREFKNRPVQDVKFFFESLWCGMLRLPDATKITGRTFFECGGNSQLAVKLLSRLNAVNIVYPRTLLSHLLGQFSFEQCCSLLNIKTIEEENVILPFVKKEVLSLEWSYNMGACVDASPTLLLLDGLWYVVVGSHSSQLSMVRCSNGQELWNTLLGDRIESGVAVAPDSSRLFTGCYDHNIYCLDSRKGNTVWRFSTQAMVKSTPALSNDATKLFCGSYDKQLYCLSTKDGSLIGKVALGGSILAQPAITGDKVLVGCLDGTCASVSETMQVLWKTKLTSPLFSSPCISSDGSHVMFAEVEGRVHSFRIDNGLKDWSVTCGGNIFSGLKCISKRSNDDMITFGCHDGSIYLLSVATGLIIWKVAVGSPVACAPAIRNNGTIVCVASTGYLCLINLEGSLLAKIQLPNEAFSAPMVMEDFIFLGCRNDCLLCYRGNK